MRARSSPAKPKYRNLRERNGRWEYRFQFGGSPVQQMTDFEATEQNASLALAAMGAHLKLLMAGDANAPTRIVAFDAAAAQFLDWYKGERGLSTWERTRVSYVSLVTFFGQRALSAVGAGDVDDYKQWRRSCGIKAPTLHNDLCNLSLLFGYGKRRNWTKTNPVDEVEKPSVKDAVRINVLTPDMESRYFAAARQRSTDLADVGMIMLAQGCRPEEVMELQQSSIDLASRRFRILAGKTLAAKRTLRMTKVSYEIFGRRLEKPGKWVFPSPLKPGRPISKLQRAHESVLSQFGDELVFVPYDLRHTFATRMACAGCPLPILAQILGHANPSCVQKYVHPSQQMMDEAMDRYNTTGQPWEPPPMPPGARDFSDIVEIAGTNVIPAVMLPDKGLKVIKWRKSG